MFHPSTAINTTDYEDGLLPDEPTIKTLPGKVIGTLTGAVKDSGERRKFETGAQRDIQKGKGRFDLLPFRALRRVARRFEGGADKYGEHNWRKGIPMSSYADSMLRHIADFMEGNTEEDHLAAVGFNALALMETQQLIQEGKLPASLNDLWEAGK